MPVDLAFEVDSVNGYRYDDFIALGNVVESRANVDFIAVKAGDVVYETATDSSIQPAFLFSDLTICEGQVNFSISVDDFVNVNALRLSFEWDSTRLNINEATYNLPLGIAQVDQPFRRPGATTIIWSSENFEGVTLPDGTSLMTFWFDVSGEVGDDLGIRFTENPSPLEVKLAREGCQFAAAEVRNRVIRYENIEPVPVVEVLNSAICSQTGNGGIDISVNSGTPPYTFRWNTRDTTEDLTQIPTGSYRVSVTDAIGCRAVSSLIIRSTDTYEVQLERSDSQMPSCWQSADGSLQANLNNGIGQIDYSWNIGDTTAHLVRLAGGQEYTVTATDTNGCADTLSLFLERPPRLDFSGTITNATRDTSTNGSVSLEVEGGVPPYQFAWNTGDTTQSLSNLAVGNYIVTVTDANGCSLSKGFAVSFNITTSTDDLAKAGLHVTHFPNPVTENLHFSLQSVAKFPLDLQMLDVTGRVVQTVAVRSANFTLDMQQYPSGLYFFRFSQKGKQLAVGRFVKQ